MTNHYRYLTIIAMAFVVITLLTLTAGAVPLLSPFRVSSPMGQPVPPSPIRALP
jgi:hypothetical protein